MEFKTSRMEVGEYVDKDVINHTIKDIYWSIYYSSHSNYRVNIFVKGRILRLNFLGWRLQGTI